MPCSSLCIPCSPYFITHRIGAKQSIWMEINHCLASDHSPHNFLLLLPLQVNTFVSTDPVNNVDMPICTLLSEFDRDISAWKTGKGSLQMYLLI